MAGTSTRLRALLGAAALLAGLVAVPGASGAPAGRLTLVGDRDAATDVVVRRTSDVILDDLRLQTRGTHAGIAIQDASGRVVAFSLNVRRWIEAHPAAAKFPITALQATPDGFATARITLTPGRYRIRLLTDGATTVSVGATGDLVKTAKPRTPAPADVRVREITNAQGLPVGAAVERMDLRRAKLYVFGIHTEAHVHQASAANFCLASVGATACHPTNDIGGVLTTTTLGATPNEGFLRRTIYVPSGAPDDRGAYDALFRDASVDLPARRDSIVVIL
jgi:hypothetical protein